MMSKSNLACKEFPDDLNLLWKMAESYGIVTVVQHPDKTYKVRIKFQTLSGIVLEATSDWPNSVVEAFHQALEKARIITDSSRKGIL